MPLRRIRDILNDFLLFNIFLLSSIKNPHIFPATKNLLGSLSLAKVTCGEAACGENVGQQKTHPVRISMAELQTTRLLSAKLPTAKLWRDEKVLR